VEDFSLLDPGGQTHTPADWQGSRAVVLLFLGTECPISNGYVPELQRLAHEYGPRGVAFRGVYPDPDVSAEVAERHSDEYGLAFPTLLDPEQDLADQVGVTITPEAAVLNDCGQVVYRGRIDDRYVPEGRRRPRAGSRDLRDALDAVLDGRAPSVAETEAVGCPLPEARAVEPDAEVVYTRHVAPILWKRCAGCHRPGEVGPFSLLTYQDAAKRAGFIRDVTADRRMPPWRPRPGFGRFHDEARLSRHELAVLADWADAGAPEGDPADLPPPPSFPQGWQIGEPDLVLEMPEPFLIPAGEDIYRAFVLPIPLDTAQWLAAIEFRPGNRRVAHHARFYVDTTSDCRIRDQADGVPGFPTVGGSDIPKPTLGAWTPGSIPRLPPSGIGLDLKAGSDFILLIHYHGTGKPETDRSSVGLYFARSPITRSMYTIPLSTIKINIPAGESRHRISQHATIPADVHAYSVLPHGHLLMREIKLWAALPDGTIRRLLWIDDWDFNWQGQYHFADPVSLPAGTRLHLVAYYDNSEANPFNPNSPPVRVRYGLTSRDEMLGCYLQILPDDHDAEEGIRKKGWLRSL
jgi:peroxiredoxin